MQLVRIMLASPETGGVLLGAWRDLWRLRFPMLASVTGTNDNGVVCVFSWSQRRLRPGANNQLTN
ncbi:hypothetical protein GCM10009721_34010 [Terrabacter tumescens]|uniref:Uncharacterized protein n=1 Tax=Terrabacter tumescens TaxID=60443 RepID=A0ABQ2IC07_9MICO|nr:hypothetical protein GCM10009721_34010 [Terrabacter tumescens]